MGLTKLVKQKHGDSYHWKWYAANIRTMKLVAQASEADFKAAQAALQTKKDQEAP